MLIRILLLISLIASTSLLAQESSKLGLNYLAITKNQVLADIMYDLEPKLITVYSQKDMTASQIKSGFRGIALGLSKDKTYTTVIDRIRSVSPETLLKFAMLPKENFPMLWAIRKGERIDQELTTSLGLYKALNGKLV